jgi:hypothetical protein
MKITTIHGFAVSFLALGFAAACTVTTTKDSGDGGDKGTGATSGEEDAGSGGNGEGGKGAGGSGANGGSHAGGSGGAAGGGAAGDSGDLDGGTGSGGAAGSGNTVGDSGADGATPAGGSDPCDQAEAKTNDDRDHATPYALGSEFDACLQKNTDVDFYSYTIPSSPAQGGYVVVSITQVGTEGGMDMTTQAAADNGDVVHTYGTGGQSIFTWFNAAAGASFRLAVKYFNGGDKPTPYTLKIAYKGVPDANEPNDLRTKATAIMNGKAVSGYLFAGYVNSTGIVDSTWEDWFKVTLPAGTASLALTDLASDVNGNVTLYDANGSQISNKYEPTEGASVVMSQSVTAGDYYVKVTPFTTPGVKGEGSNVPAYLGQAYTLTVGVP